MPAADLASRRYRLAALNLGLGLVLILTPAVRTSAPSFDAARELLPIPVHGLLIGTLGLLLAVLAKRAAARPVLLVAAGYYAFWTLLFLLSALQNPTAALTALPVYGYIVVAHLAVSAGRDS